ncbi:hypothetical protein VIGAN_UM149100 [Vigna angularis var. angularis]|uniref:SRP9 domain-containing protein n=1 Tax=Vigna angularis var. angularis TaxID=157739 RepID=A0A0S3TEW2_PHAAN|nr:uncharacterized protein LOC108338908 isoform X2 [Vigna angularis]BAU03647.1 hypothetical protein VIGAN_UM149100 [Vigna angularis var. angularis]
MKFLLQLYLEQTRYVMKYRHCDGKLVLKVTDNRRLEMNKLSEDVSSFVNCLSLSLIFIGNPGLCGYWLDSSCQGSHPTERGERRSNAREYKQQKNLVANRKMLLSRTNNSQI